MATLSVLTAGQKAQVADIFGAAKTAILARYGTGTEIRSHRILTDASGQPTGIEVEVAFDSVDLDTDEHRIVKKVVVW